MVGLETTDNNLVGIAIGQENDNYWYVQTTPIDGESDLSEHIQELLESKEHALAIAQLYIEKYGFKLFIWNNSIKIFNKGRD